MLKPLSGDVVVIQISATPTRPSEKNLYLCTVDLIFCGEGCPLHLFEVPLFGTLPLNWCEMAHVKLWHGFPRRKAQERCIHISYNSYKWMQNLSVVQ